MISRRLISLWRELREEEKREVSPSSGGSFYILLVFPNTYSVGISNLGFQILFSLLNRIPDVVCDLLYYPDEDVIPQIESGQELCSFYLERTPREFDALFFSVSFENDLVNLIRLLRWMRIDPLTNRRDDGDPVVIGGGIVPTANPEPFAPFFDAVYLGEAEPHLPEVVEILLDSPSKRDFLEKVSLMPFVYVPSLVDVEENGGFLVPKGVEKRRTFWREFSEFPSTSVILSKHSSFGSAFIVEVSRGCPRRCSFCLSSYVCRPVRFASAEAIFKIVEKSGEKKIGFLGTSVSDHKHLPEVLERFAGKREFTFSSLRIDADIRFLEALKYSGLKTATFGIEAATFELRKRIGKPIPDELIFERVRWLSGHFETLKLYFMVGLPGETEEDIEAFGRFISKIADLFEGKIAVSLSPFVPKPFTPFEREAFDGHSILKTKIKRILKLLRPVKKVHVSYDLPKWSQLQAMISRGDRRVGLYLAGEDRKLNQKRYLGPLKGSLLPWHFISVV